MLLSKDKRRRAGVRDVHAKKERPCPTCTGFLVWVRVENRMTWWCLACGSYSAFVRVEEGAG